MIAKEKNYVNLTGAYRSKAQVRRKKYAKADRIKNSKKADH